MTIEMADELTTKEYAPQGYRVDTLVEQEMAWSSFALSGDALYTETLYALENMLGTVTPTSLGTKTKKRVYDLPPTGGITPKTWSIQFGDPADNVNTAGYGLLTDYGEKYDREAGVTLSGAGIAQIIATGATFTATPITLASKPILGAHINYYLDTTGAGIGTTQITDEVLSAEWNIKGIKGPRWVSDRSQKSFKGHVDLKTKTDVKLSLAESPTTRAIIANLRVGGAYFLRIDAQGDTVENTQTLTITGTPTGGTFTLTYKTQTTSAIPYNATSAAVQTALAALSTIGAGNVTVSGGPGPGTPYVVTFTGALLDDTTLMTSAASFTGGTSPAIAVTQTDFFFMAQRDIAFKLMSIAKYSDNKGVYMREVSGVLVHDSAWGHSFMATSQTDVATL